MEKEIWKDIPGYKGYLVSDMGNVKSIDREVIAIDGKKYYKKGMSLKISDSRNNGATVNILGKTTPVHYLVCITFIGERPKGYDICHKNGNPKDNRLVNLRYDSKSQNQIDMYRQGMKTGNAKLEIEDVLKIRRLYSKEGYSQRKLAKIFNISKTQIGNIVRKDHYSWLNDDGTIRESENSIW